MQPQATRFILGDRSDLETSLPCNFSKQPGAQDQLVTLHRNAASRLHGAALRFQKKDVEPPGMQWETLWRGPVHLGLSLCVSVLGSVKARQYSGTTSFM